ncbi:MAG: universal stress protein [Acidobacteriota bacterium]
MSILTISRVLCAVDLSDASRLALRQALFVARQHDATVRVIHVLDPGSPPSTREGTLFDITPEMRAAVEEDLNWLVAALLDAEVPIDTHVREGRVVPTILEEAEAMKADIIVIGTHGRSGFQRLALGSVAGKIIRAAPCPVLAVPPPVKDDAPVLARVVLCPTDFSPAARAAVDYARFMAQHSGAALSLVTVTEWPFGESPEPGPIADLMHSIDAEAQRHLDGARLEAGPPIRTSVLHGKPWKVIVDFARRERAGLIVMGATGRETHGLALLGSTTAHVVREGVCPVLTVPAVPRT